MTASTVDARTAAGGRLGRLLVMAVRSAAFRVNALPAHVAVLPSDVLSAAPSPTARCYLTALVNGVPARVCEISADGARVELSVPLDLDDVTFSLDRDGESVTRSARVVSYRRHPDGPASYGLEFATD